MRGLAGLGLAARKSLAALCELREPVDAVYTWGGIGPQPAGESWAGEGTDCAADAFTANRRADHGELRYSLRSLERHAPFVRHVFIVTSERRRPDWLRLPHPRLTLVDDTELFPDPTHLPTRNSQAIECHLHRIPGLSERFLYLNDDMFFAGSVRPRDLLTPDGRLRVFLEPNRSLTPTGAAPPQESSYTAAWRNNNRLLDHRFGPQPRPFPQHQACVLSRTIHRAMHEDPTLGPALARTSASRGRSRRDVAPVGLHQYYALHTGAATPGSMRASFVALVDDAELDRSRLQRALEARPRLLCLNDDMREPPAAALQELSCFLEGLFPYPSSFERAP